MIGRRLRLCLALVLVAFSALALAGQALAADPVVDAAGDLACSPTDPNYNSGNGVPSATYPAANCVQKAVSNLVANQLPTAFLTTGDNQYGTYNGSDNGSLAQWNQVYGPTFGRANSVVYPTLGNGDYGDTGTPDSSQFFAYFNSTGLSSRIAANGGDNSHLATLGYYSFNIGGWHLIALNSNCAALTGIGQHGCGIGSPEEKWLKADLAANPGKCTLAYWHVPRWNSGRLGNQTDGAAFWTDLYNAHADLVLNAHGNNHYERFKAQNPSGNPDPNGIVEFILSNGGYSHGNPPSGNPPVAPGDPNTSVVADYTSFGILQLTLHPTGYDYHYIPAVGSFTDSGSGSCHSTEAAFTAPTNGQTNVDTTKPFTWSTVSAAQGYYMTIGTTPGGYDLVNSGALPASQSSLNVPGLPTGQTLYARIYTELNGNYNSYQDITFTAAPNAVAFTYPTNGQANVDTTKPFTWSTVSAAQGYYLEVGTTKGGYDLVNSGPLPASQSSYNVPALPGGQTLYARIYTELNGNYNNYQDITFTAAPGDAAFTYPTNGQANVDTTQPFTWSTVSAAQGYYLEVGTTKGGYDLVNSGPLPASQSSYNVPALPTGQTLYARIYTELNGNYNNYQDIAFTAAARGGAGPAARASARASSTSVPGWLSRASHTRPRPVPGWLSRASHTRPRPVPSWLSRASHTRLRPVPGWLARASRPRPAPTWLVRLSSVAHIRIR